MENNSVCEMLYRPRDALMEDKLQYALMLSREVHEKIAHMVYSKHPIDCTLQCEVKENNETK